MNSWDSVYGVFTLRREVHIEQQQIEVCIFVAVFCDNKNLQSWDIYIYIDCPDLSTRITTAL